MDENMMAEAAEVDESAALRGEVEALRAELAAERRLSGELREFCSLYPEAAVEAIPEHVWGRVKAGIPLAAAYALHERQQLCARQAAEAARTAAAARSSGAVGGSAGEMLYTAAEVRAMSGEDVRRNYALILKSMQGW